MLFNRIVFGCIGYIYLLQTNLKFSYEQYPTYIEYNKKEWFL